MTAKKRIKKTVGEAGARPEIPKLTQMRLWATHAGRCAFPGCNELLLRDKVTMRGINRSNIAHIVSWGVNGPRGHKTRSKELATSFDNLMLMCLDCHIRIDGPNWRNYPETMLLEWKREHEERIRLATAVTASHKTEVVMLLSNFGKRQGFLSHEQAVAAIQPGWFPASVHGTTIDLTGTQISDDDPKFFSFWQHEITRQVEAKLSSDHGHPDHFSVFAFASIPLMMHFGTAFGDTRRARIFQRHKDTENWVWRDDDLPAGFEYSTSTSPEKPTKSAEVGLALSLSGHVLEEEVRRDVLGDAAPLYDITIPNPNRDYLHTEQQLAMFLSAYWRVLSEIRSTHGGDVVIHVFPAVPVSVAVEVGRRLLPKADPKMRVYDYQLQLKKWRFCLTL